MISWVCAHTQFDGNYCDLIWGGRVMLCACLANSPLLQMLTWLIIMASWLLRASTLHRLIILAFLDSILHTLRNKSELKYSSTSHTACFPVTLFTLAIIVFAGMVIWSMIREAQKIEGMNCYSSVRNSSWLKLQWYSKSLILYSWLV